MAKRPHTLLNFSLLGPTVSEIRPFKVQEALHSVTTLPTVLRETRLPKTRAGGSENAAATVLDVDGSSKMSKRKTYTKSCANVSR